MVAGGSITRYEARVLAAPGANTSFAAFVMGRYDAGVRITISLTTASVLNLISTDGTTAYTSGLKDSETLSAADEHVINVPALPVNKPGTGLGTGTAAVAMAYALQVETDSVIRYVRIDELLTSEFGAATRDPPSAAAIAAAIVANPPTIVVTDPASVYITATLVGIDVAIATGQYTASAAVAWGGTYSVIIRDALVAQYEDGTGAILTDMYGDLVFFDSDPALAAASTTLTAAQAAKVCDRIAFTNSELYSDTNVGILGPARIEKVLPAATGVWAAFFWRGATSINSAAGDDERLVIRVGAERVT